MPIYWVENGLSMQNGDIINIDVNVFLNVSFSLKIVICLVGTFGTESYFDDMLPFVMKFILSSLGIPWWNFQNICMRKSG